ncbi:WhiB family transcriptional regulator [Streptomyces sp. NPDC004059]
MTHYSGSVPDTEPVPHWRDDAACAEVDPDIFFSDNSQTVREAKKVCVRCPSRLRCAMYAIDNGENWGVWGGMTQTELRTQRNRRRQQQRDAA